MRSRHVREQIEPELRELRQDLAPVAYPLGQYHIEHTGAIGTDMQLLARSGVVDVADLACVDWGECHLILLLVWVELSRR